MGDYIDYFYEYCLIDDQFFAIIMNDRIIIIPIDQDLNHKEVSMIIFRPDARVAKMIKLLDTSDLFNLGETFALETVRGDAKYIFQELPSEFEELRDQLSTVKERGFIESNQLKLEGANSIVGKIFLTAKESILGERHKNLETE